jgi:hypothetical protein
MYKILEVFEPRFSDRLGRTGLYRFRLRVQYHNGVVGIVDLTKFGYKVIQLKIKILKQGIKEELIEDFAEAVRAESDYDHSMNEDD